MFLNQASEFVYTRTYSRWIDSLNRRETWEETVDRYITFIVKHRGENIPPKVIKKIKRYLMEFEVMPSMRAMWAAGGAAEADNVTIFNCSFSKIQSITDFAESLYILMCGTGFGFSVSRTDVQNLPIVPQMTSLSLGTHTVEDSRSGWANSLKALIQALYDGKDLEMDYSLCRQKGARLKTMGGRSSGPAPLIGLHNFCRELFSKAQGRKLLDIEAHDLECKIAEIVVVGGVRRSSEISLSDLDSESMMKAKVFPFPPHRYMANNSAIYHKKPTAVEFLKEWSSLAASGSGERGIFNLEAARKSAPPRRDASKIAGTNPCVTGDTKILTDDGYKTIESLVDTEVTIWNGYEWSKVTPKVTGTNQEVLTVTFSDGRVLNCTPYHNFHIADGYTGESYKVEAKNLEPGMKLIKHEFPIIEHGEDYKYAYAQGFISAEGMDGYDFCWVYEPKYSCLTRLNGTVRKEWNGRSAVKFDHELLPKSFVPFNWNLKSKLQWLAGLFDGDGTELKEGGLQLVSTNRHFLSNLQTLLSTVGVQSKISLGNKAGLRSMPDGHGGMKDFECQDAWRICVGAVQMQSLKSLGLKCERMSFNKSPQRDASQFVRIVDVTEGGIADKVYCFTEPKRSLGIFNGILTGNCGEIMLWDKEFCNLSEVVIRSHDDVDTLLEKVETATWIGAIQSTFTYFPYLSEEWKNNCEEERLLGVSLTGQMDNPEILTPEVLRALKRKALKVAAHAAKKLGINMPAAVTCVKPSGTVSQLVDSSSGIHTRYSPYYIRRYRISSSDPLFKMLKDQGVPCCPEVGQTAETADTWVLAFPVKSPDNAITRNDLTALQQLEHYKKIQANWCEHNASATIYVKDAEWFEVGNWVYQNWDYINGVSFLPHDGGMYELAPYEEIDKAKYEELLSGFPKIDYSKLTQYELEDNTEGAKSLACVSGICEI